MTKQAVVEMLNVFCDRAGSHHVDVTVAMERYGHACLEDAVAEAQQFLHRDAAHLYGGEQRCNLRVVELALCDGDEQVLGFFALQLLMVEQAVENLCYVHNRFCFLFVFVLACRVFWALICVLSVGLII